VTSCNPDNERLKRRYFDDLKESEGRSSVTIDHAARALAEYERFTDWKDFKRFTRKDAIAYRRSLLAGGGRRAAQLSSRATIHSKLLRLAKFFRWLAREPGYKTRIRPADVECFSLSLRDQLIARQRTKEQPTPSLEQVLAAIRALPAETDVQLRDRALMACLLLTACRVKAMTTLKLRHLRRDRLGIDLDALDVHTKLGKSFTTFFVPVADDVKDMLLDYVDHLRFKRGWTDANPLFPKSELAIPHGSSVSGLSRDHWRDTEAARRVCRRAFAAAALPYYSPQAIRRTVVRLGEQRCRTAEEFKAWSQNVGHEDTLTSFRNYGEVPLQRQAELIQGLIEETGKGPDANAVMLAELVAEKLLQAQRSAGTADGSIRP
jgi:site-specific recombinase XerD